MVGLLSQLPRDEVMPRASELLERFALTDAADRPLRTYSGGMRRRLDVAASLVPKPPILFLDEPTTGLDLTSRNALWELIRELVDEGTTVLLTTQYLEEADRLAERIAVVDGGHVIANDTPANLKSQLGDTVVEIVLHGDGRASRAASLLAGDVPGKVEQEGDTVRITSDQGAKVLIDALRALDVAGLTPDTLTVREPSLDDVFLSLTGRHAEDAEQAAQQEAQSPRRRGRR
jgi:ABC-type multidrug transport system ATPase subunit